MDLSSLCAKLWAENAVQYNITQPVRVSDWMSGWMESDGVLSSFHFNVFSDSLRIRIRVYDFAPPGHRSQGRECVGAADRRSLTSGFPPTLHHNIPTRTSIIIDMALPPRYGSEGRREERHWCRFFVLVFLSE